MSASDSPESNEQKEQKTTEASNSFIKKANKRIDNLWAISVGRLFSSKIATGAMTAWFALETLDEISERNTTEAFIKGLALISTSILTSKNSLKGEEANSLDDAK